MRLELGLEGLVFLTPFGRRDLKMGDPYKFPKTPVWLRYGLITGGDEGWYLAIGLPSWAMKASIWTPEPKWHQRILGFIGHVTRPAMDPGWRVLEIPIE